jgi:hypothetical protein
VASTRVSMTSARPSSPTCWSSLQNASPVGRDNEAWEPVRMRGVRLRAPSLIILRYEMIRRNQPYAL